MHSPDDQTARAEWVSIGTFATGLDADIARSALEAEQIPVLMQGNAPGIFGLSYQGNVAGGVTLQVPSPEVTRALALLEGSNDAIDADDDETLSP